MNNKNYEQIIDDVYKKYTDKYVGYDDTPTKELFVYEIKTNKDFSEKWGLKIEEKDLSLTERGELFREIHPNKSVDDFKPGGMEVQSLRHQLNTRYDNAKIPTKLITITYNGNQIENYE